MSGSDAELGDSTPTAFYLRPGFWSLGALIGLAVAGYFASRQQESRGCLHSSILLIALPGAVGGLLYSMRERKLVLPRFHSDAPYTLDPGFVSDIWFGIAGAYIAFLIVPGNFKFDPTAAKADPEAFWAFVKITALAIVGGYGGRALVDKALADIARKIDRVEQVQKNVEKRLTDQELQAQRDADALKLVATQLDGGTTAAEVPADRLADALAAASRSARSEVALRARTLRNQCWKEQQFAQMARSIPVFEALIQLDPNDEVHRHHGQLGYALKDRIPPDLARAKAELSKAIWIRDRAGESGFLFYEFNRAICNIRMDPDYNSIPPRPSVQPLKDEILGDLRSAAQDSYIFGVIQADDLIGGWMRLNGVVLDPPEP